MHSLFDLQKRVVFIHWEHKIFSFCHLFNEQDNQLMAKKLDGGETKTALS